MIVSNGTYPYMSLLTVLGEVRVGRSLVLLQQTEHTRGHL
jgi:hypothetical protein